MNSVNVQISFFPFWCSNPTTSLQARNIAQQIGTSVTMHDKQSDEPGVEAGGVCRPAPTAIKIVAEVIDKTRH